MRKKNEFELSKQHNCYAFDKLFCLRKLSSFCSVSLRRETEKLPSSLYLTSSLSDVIWQFRVLHGTFILKRFEIAFVEIEVEMPERCTVYLLRLGENDSFSPNKTLL